MNIDYKGRKKPRIRMLISCFGWDSGSEFNIHSEDDDGLYFYDSFRRWTVVYKKDEGREFAYVRKVESCEHKPVPYMSGTRCRLCGMLNPPEKYDAE